MDGWRLPGWPHWATSTIDDWGRRLKTELLSRSCRAELVSLWEAAEDKFNSLSLAHNPVRTAEGCRPLVAKAILTTSLKDSRLP
jgi:hypothetical protein